MWKIAAGFLVFAGIALYMLSKGGDVDISGNEHGSTAEHAPAAVAPASAPASASK